MPSILDLYTKTVENVQDFVTDTMWRALGWPSEDAWREAGSPDMTYNAYQTQGGSAGAVAAPVGPQPLEAVTPNVVEPLAPATPPTPAEMQEIARGVADTVQGTVSGFHGLAQQAAQGLMMPQPIDYTEGGLRVAGTPREALLQQREGTSVNPLGQIGELIPNPIENAVSAGYGAVGDALDFMHRVNSASPQVGIGRGAQALNEVVQPREPWELALEATPIGLMGDINSMQRTLPLDELTQGAASALVRGTPVDAGTDAARVLTGPGMGRPLPEGATFNPGMAGGAIDDVTGMGDEALSGSAPLGSTAGLPETTVEAVARNILNTSNPDEVVDQIRQLDAMQRMELSLLVGDGNLKAMRDFGALVARAEQGDRMAADQLARTFFRDNAVVRNRAAQMERLMESLKNPNSSMFSGIPVDFAALPRPGSLKDEATALVGLPRTLKASFDLSAPGRQGLALAFRHPKEWLEAWKPMLQAWKSEDGMRVANEKIDNIMGQWRAKYGDVIHSYQTGAGAEGLERVPGFEAAGEGIVSGVTRQIPGLEKSERAYATFLNYQKAKTFDTMARALERAGVTDAESFKHLGSIIDHATGYGAAPLKGRFEGQAFFSQRYLTSRLQFLVDPIVEGLARGDLRAAQAAAENMVAFMGGMAGLAFLANESGVVDVNLDPRSSDFGKFRIGPQRFDFGAGFLPVLRTAARVATGQGKSGTGGIYDIDEKNELLKFFRNKLAPIPSEVVTRLVGEDPVGDKPVNLTSPDFARQMFMPLIADAVLEAFEETGSPMHAGLAAVSELVGGGTSTYGVGQSMQRAISEERFGKEYDGLDSRQQAEVNAEIIESGTPMEWRERVAPWWTARDDAFSYWKATVDAESKAHPVVAHVLEQDEIAGIFPTPDSDGELAQWIQRTYGVSRQEAVDYANSVMRTTGLDDLIKRFRGQVPTIDTGFAQAWLDAYNAGDADDGPPKWVRDMIQEAAGVR